MHCECMTKNWKRNVALGLMLAMVSWTSWGDERASPEAATGTAAGVSVAEGSAMAVTANPLATRAAAQILGEGGAAMDAAVAAAFVLNVVEPQSSGIGGGGFLLTFDAAGGELVAWDGRETAPTEVDEYLFFDDGRPLAFMDAVVGGRAVGVPGMVSMLEAAHAESGRLPWARLLEPAIELAEQGFEVSPRLAGLIARDRFLKDDSLARTLFFDASGEPLAAGSWLINPQLGEVLRAIAERGADALHHGEIARDIVAAVRQGPNPGSLHETDLASYAPVRREALCGAYRLFRVCGMPPLSAGGGTVLALLGMLERFDLAQLDADVAFATHVFSEAGRLAYADSNAWYGDPAAMSVSAEQLVAPDYLALRADQIEHTTSLGRAKPGQPEGAIEVISAPSLERPSTTHLSIADAEGNAVSLTLSLEHVFGSRRMVRGFLLNNQLTDFAFIPETADGGLHPNRPGPGKRPRSSMAPTMLFNAEGDVHALTGSPGGSRIINYVAASIVGLVDWKLPPEEVVARTHAGSRNGPTEIEDTPAGRALARQLERFGHTPRLADMTSGLAVIVRENGKWRGAADPRREGTAEAVMQ